MNQKNLDYLKDQLKYSGFGEELQSKLAENLQKAQNEFSIKHVSSYGKDELSVSLNFKKSANSDMYFFNNYRAELQKPGAEAKVSQTFYINNEGRNITQKEAYNLLDGRSVNKDLVNKEGQFHNAWLKLDFKETAANSNYKTRQFSPQYGFELEKAVAKLPIKELADDTAKVRLFESLERGNRQAVTFTTDQGEQKRFIEANPQFKSVTVYDENQKRIRQAEDQGKSQGNKESLKEDTSQKKENTVADDTGGEKTGKRKGVKM
ncbi:hypothetical protein SAMN04487996_111261 [Dyadobacter soli]|uniref:DUF3945 domain-containing protein n=1 Tax=Dyadobacter soli TaxID=659014 RepID=A0A1G7MGM1_9BACT|nr:hypothetical protein [Dyadobacter soli]SDF60861.1 hypothetical protein SAMN04487996_111261 [Dyadobacter soli]